MLENLLGAPPPAPPENVPALEATTLEGTLRQRMEQHRRNPVCATCHRVMDPLGFALENFSPLGEWRTEDAGETVDATGQMPDGVPFDGVSGLRAALLARSDVFVSTLTEKMLTYALGRGLEYYGRAGCARDHEGRCAGRQFVLVVGPRDREQCTVPDAGGVGADLAGDRCECCSAVTDDPEEISPMIVMRRALPRRMFLRGVGASLALPLLDAMVPAFTAVAKSAAAPVRRLGFIYSPNGYIRQYWTPEKVGTDFEFTPSLKALEPFRDKLVVVTGLANMQAAAMGDSPGPHFPWQRGMGHRLACQAD